MKVCTLKRLSSGFENNSFLKIYYPRLSMLIAKLYHTGMGCNMFLLSSTRTSGNIFHNLWMFILNLPSNYKNNKRKLKLPLSIDWHYYLRITWYVNRFKVLSEGSECQKRKTFFWPPLDRWGPQGKHWSMIVQKKTALQYFKIIF